MGRSISIKMQIDLTPLGNQEETWAQMRETIYSDKEYKPEYDLDEDYREALEVKLLPPFISERSWKEGEIRWCDPKGEYDSGDRFYYHDEIAWQGPYGGYCLQNTVGYEEGLMWHELETHKQSLTNTAQELAERFNLTLGEVSLQAIYF
jgi:hypothetical protein